MDSVLDMAKDVYEKEGMTPQTCRAARGLLGLSQDQLGKLAGVTMLTVRNYEAGKTDPAYTTWRSLRTALERAGIIFLDEDEDFGPGVRMKKGR